MTLQAVKGTRDILPDEMPAWRRVEEAAHRLFQRYGYREIRTPIFEATELFARGIGSETDIVSKEMYTFADRGAQDRRHRVDENDRGARHRLREEHLHRAAADLAADRRRAADDRPNDAGELDDRVDVDRREQSAARAPIVEVHRVELQKLGRQDVLEHDPDRVNTDNPGSIDVLP